MLAVLFLSVTICSGSPVQYLSPEYQESMFNSVFSGLMRSADPSMLRQIPAQVHPIVFSHFVKGNRELVTNVLSALLKVLDIDRICSEFKLIEQLNRFMSTTTSSCMYWWLPVQLRENYASEVIPVDVAVTESNLTAEEQKAWRIKNMSIWRIRGGFSRCEPLMGHFVSCIDVERNRVVIDLMKGCGVRMKQSAGFSFFFPFLTAVVRIDRASDLSFSHKATLYMGEASPIAWQTNHLQYAYVRESNVLGSMSLRALVYKGSSSDTEYKDKPIFQEIYQVEDFYVRGNEISSTQGLKQPLGMFLKNPDKLIWGQSADDIRTCRTQDRCDTRYGYQKVCIQTSDSEVTVVPKA